jgi:hypothetical protein
VQSAGREHLSRGISAFVRATSRRSARRRNRRSAHGSGASEKRLIGCALAALACHGSAGKCQRGPAAAACAFQRSEGCLAGPLWVRQGTRRSAKRHAGVAAGAGAARRRRARLLCAGRPPRSSLALQRRRHATSTTCPAAHERPPAELLSWLEAVCCCVCCVFRAACPAVALTSLAGQFCAFPQPHSWRGELKRRRAHPRGHCRRSLQRGVEAFATKLRSAGLRGAGERALQPCSEPCKLVLRLPPRLLSHFRRAPCLVLHFVAEPSIPLCDGKGGTLRVSGVLFATERGALLEKKLGSGERASPRRSRRVFGTPRRGAPHRKACWPTPESGLQANRDLACRLQCGSMHHGRACGTRGGLSAAAAAHAVAACSMQSRHTRRQRAAASGGAARGATPPLLRAQRGQRSRSSHSSASVFMHAVMRPSPL